MEYAPLGRSGIRVSRLSLGTTQFHVQVEYDRAAAIMSRALDLGINFLDTGNTYNDGKSEEYIGQWMEGRRQQVVVATKVRGRMGPGPNDTGLSRLHMMQAVEESLRRLRTDYIDLYQVHAPDPLTPIETTLRALDDMVRQGKVRAIGCSNFAAWELCKALWTSDVRDYARFESVQPRYNVLAREIEAELLPLCSSEQVGAIVYNPIAGGMLSGKYRWGAPPPAGTRFAVQGEIYLDRYWYEGNLQAVERLKPIAEQSGRTLAQFAIAWVMKHPAVTSTIVGATSVSQLEENVAALERPLSDDEHRAAGEAATGAIQGPAAGPRDQ